MARMCSVCGKRPAVYFHRASGDYLCLPCLERRLARYVRKAFGKYRLVAEYRPRLALAAHPLLMVESAAGLRLLSIVEKGYTSRLTLLWPRSMCVKLLDKALGSSKLPVDVVEYEAPSNSRSLCKLDRLVRRRIVETANNTDVEYIALPYPRDYSIAVAIEGLLGGNPYCLLDSQPLLPTSRVKLIKPFHEILWEDMLAYAIVVGFLDGFEDCIPSGTNPSLELLASTALPGGPELLYSFSVLVGMLASDLEDVGSCRLCGGYENKIFLRNHNGLCRVCSLVKSQTQP